MEPNTATQRVGRAGGCRRCGEPSFAKSKTGLCAKHYRFFRMRSDAKYQGKPVPTTEQLESLSEGGMACRDCGVQMNWFQADGVASVVTLQHYRSGAFGLVCRSCNSAHANWPGDVFVSVRRDREKYCPDCKAIRPLSDFRKHGGSRAGVYSYCRDCDRSRRACVSGVCESKGGI